MESTIVLTLPIKRKSAPVSCARFFAVSSLAQSCCAKISSRNSSLTDFSAENFTLPLLINATLNFVARIAVSRCSSLLFEKLPN